MWVDVGGCGMWDVAAAVAVAVTVCVCEIV